MTARIHAIVSCEHAGNEVPGRWTGLFDDARHLLTTHRAWDPGALEVAQELATSLGTPLFYTRITRLLVDTNRSHDNPEVFSELTRDLPAIERRRMLAAHHRPHRDGIRSAVRSRLRDGGLVVHLAVHSFTPVLDGVTRDADVGWLYDPEREPERELAELLHDELSLRNPGLRIRHNYPYLGTSDGLTTTLRGELGPPYLGLELELSQGSLGDEAAATALRSNVRAAVSDALDRFAESKKRTWSATAADA